MKYYGTDYTSNDLSHYGVPGMKWGVRKAKSAVSSYRSSRRVSRDAKFENDVNKKVNKELEKQRKKERRKKIAYGLAGAAAVAGIAYAMNKHNKNVAYRSAISNRPPAYLPNGRASLSSKRLNPNNRPPGMPPIPSSAKKKTYTIGGRIKEVSSSIPKIKKKQKKTSYKGTRSAIRANQRTTADFISNTNKMLKRK